MLEVGETPYGKRLIVEAEGGEFEGPKLKGTLRKAGCADWISVCEDFLHMDVRATLETHDGAFIYMEYFGRIELTPSVQAAIGGNGETEFLTTH